MRGALDRHGVRAGDEEGRGSAGPVVRGGDENRGQRALDRQSRQLAGQRLEVLVRSSARALRQGAHTLDRLVERLPFQRAERMAQQFTELPNIVAERLVGIGGHVPEYFGGRLS